MGHAFKVIRDEAVGVIKIKEDCQFNKIRAEKVIVCENVTARLFGSVNDLILQKGSKLLLHGMLYGRIENKGGEVIIFRN